MSARRLIVMLVLLAGGGAIALPVAPAWGEPLVADLTSHLIAITTGFTGTSVVLFGATDGGGDVIVVVRGPEREVVVRHKRRIAGIWINTREVTFSAVPSFYAVLGSHGLDEIAPPSVQALHQIGLGSLRLAARDEKRHSPAELAAFRSALIEERRRQGLYVDTVGKVSFLGNRLFRATINFPANVPTGTYLVEVFLVRDKVVASGQTTPLIVSQVGVNAEVGDFADHRALAYGFIAVAGAAVAGWLASLPFRKA